MSIPDIYHCVCQRARGLMQINMPPMGFFVQMMLPTLETVKCNLYNTEVFHWALTCLLLPLCKITVQNLFVSFSLFPPISFLCYFLCSLVFIFQFNALSRFLPVIGSLPGPHPLATTPVPSVRGQRPWRLPT